MHAKGSGAYGRFTVTHDITALHASEALLPDRQADRALCPLHDRRRRARRGRRRAGHPRLRAEVLHRGRQLGPRGEQHARLLLARSAQVSGSEPRREARSADEPEERREQLGLLDATARGAAPGHDRDERSRHPRHRYRHMHGFGSHTFSFVNAEKWAILGQVPFQIAARHQEPERSARPKRSSGKTARRTSATSMTAIERGDYPKWTLFVQLMPEEQASKVPTSPLISPKCGRTATTHCNEVGVLRARTATPKTSSPRSSSRPSPRRASCRGSAFHPTRCCRRGSSLTATPSATGSASTTTKSR